MATVRVTPKRRRDNKFHSYPINTTAGVVQLSVLTGEAVTVEVDERQLLDLKHDPFVVVEEVAPEAAPEVAPEASAGFAPDQPRESIPPEEQPKESHGFLKTKVRNR